jgi:hypothetical protein
MKNHYIRSLSKVDKHRTKPDKRIIITSTIIIIEYNTDHDLMLPLYDPRAQKVLKTISLY